MTNKHKITYFFIKLWCKLNSINIGKIVYYYSEDKQKKIKGVITSFDGGSITKNKFYFDININWLEPTQGNDSRFYSTASYDLKSFHKEISF